jgi:hypothetical protein
MLSVPLRIDGLEGSYQTVEEVEREPDLATTIATFLDIAGNTLTIAMAIYAWCQAWYQKSKEANASPRIEKVLIVGSNGRRLLLKNATVEQIKEILED